MSHHPVHGKSAIGAGQLSGLSARPDEAAVLDGDRWQGQTAGDEVSRACLGTMAMNLVDAAVAVIDEAGKPLHVEELCRQVERKKLVKSQAAQLLRSMKGRLTTEAKKGEDSKLLRVAPDTWAVRNGTPAEAVQEEPESEVEAAAPEGEAQALPEAEVAAPESEVEAATPAAEVEAATPDDVVLEAAVEAGPAPVPEDPALFALYADESETMPVAELAEYRDAQTADEDRPMLPEIVAQRRGRPGYRERRGRDRERRRRGKRDTNGISSREARTDGPEVTGDVAAAPPAPARPESAAAPAPALARPASIADAAFAVLSAQGDRPVQIKQLAQMMRKRNAITGDPHAMWKVIRAVIDSDDEVRRSTGLRPRFAQRGRDLYAARSLGLPEKVARAEAAFVSAAAALASATNEALAARISALDSEAFERLVHVYLMHTGWRGIDWIKRVGPSSYAIAEPPDTKTRVMVSARSGDSPVDRRGVGELRAGVEAKALDRGVLIASTALSSVARAELSRPGKPITVIAGEDLVRALCAARIGVIAAATQVHYVDPAFFENLR